MIKDEYLDRLFHQSIHPFNLREPMLHGGIDFLTHFIIFPRFEIAYFSGFWLSHESNTASVQNLAFYFGFT